MAASSSYLFNKSEEKSVSSTLVSSNATLFARPSVPTLQELALNTLINHLGSTWEIEKFIKNPPAEYFPEDILENAQIILAKIKKLHGYINKSNLEKADKFLKDNPKILGPLLKCKGRIITDAKGLKKHVIIEGAALQFALGAEDVGREGCDLCLMPPHSPLENTDLKKLSLYSEGDVRLLKYRVKGKEHLIECGINKGQLPPKHFATLSEMYKNASLLNQNLNFSHPALNETQRDAYSAVLNITSQREHTLRENEEGVVQLLLRHLRTLADGEREIEKQIVEQFPKGWAQEEEKRYAQDLHALDNVRQAIVNSVSNTDPILLAALQEFRDYLEPKGIITKGKHWNAGLLEAAFKLGYDQYYNNDQENRKNIIFYNQVIGYAERFAPNNYAHPMAQGAYGEDKKKLNHSLKYHGGGSYYPLPSSPGTSLGFDSWVNCHSGERVVNGNVARHRVAAPVYHVFKSLLEHKTSVLCRIIMPDNPSKTQCLVM